MRTERHVFHINMLVVQNYFLLHAVEYELRVYMFQIKWKETSIIF